MLSVSGTMACGSTPTTPDFINSISFVSRLQERGSAWRTFSVTTAGAVTVQLTGITQTNAVMGLGLGTVVSNNCVLTQSLQTTATSAADAPHIKATLAVGQYCVKLYDIGQLTSIVDFSILITTPY